MSSLFSIRSDEIPDQYLQQPKKITVLGNSIRVVTILRTVSLLLIAGIGWWVGDIVGIGIGLSIAGLGFSTTPVITAAFAHTGLIVILPKLATTTAVIQLIIFEFGLIGLFSSDPPVSMTNNLLTAIFIVSFVILTLWLFNAIGVLEASIALCCVVGGVGYVLHRYERVSLGGVPSDQRISETNE